jgi:predicted transcriptional regulator
MTVKRRSRTEIICDIMQILKESGVTITILMRKSGVAYNEARAGLKLLIRKGFARAEASFLRDDRVKFVYVLTEEGAKILEQYRDIKMRLDG